MIKYLKYSIRTFSILILFYLVGSKKAYAYLDPGTGSYILQIVIAALVGSLFAIKMFWRNIISFFSNLFSKK